MRRSRSAVLAVLVLSLPLAACGGDGDDGGSAAPEENDAAIWVATLDNTVLRIDPETDQIAATIPVGRVPTDLAVGEGSVWVANEEDGSVSRIDPSTNEVTATIDTGEDADGVAVGEGAVWVSSVEESSVARIDPETNEITEEVTDVGLEPQRLGVAEGKVWVADEFATEINVIDIESMQVDETIDLDNEVFEFAFEGGSVWTTISFDNVALKMDPSTYEITGRVKGIDEPHAITAGEGAVWVAGREGVWRIDPVAGQVAAEIETEDSPTGLAAFDGFVWVGHLDVESMAKIDVETNEIVKTIELPALPGDVVAG